MQQARDRIRELTGRRRLGLWPELIAEDLNRFLRGWAAYFRYGPLGRAARQGQAVRADPACAVHQQEAQPQPQLRLADADRPVPG